MKTLTISRLYSGVRADVVRGLAVRAASSPTCAASSSDNSLPCNWSASTSNGAGFTKRYTYDRCAVRNPPPYFPTTGRFTDNRYLELDPVGFKPDVYFQTLIPN